MIAIDPGESAGYAQFRDGVLKDCGLVDDDGMWLTGGDAERIVWEHPTIYPGTKNPNNIVTLAITAGRLVERATQWAQGAEKHYLPRQWKGQIPKTKLLKDYIVYRRIVNGLDANERGVLARALMKISAEKPKFDVVDAVGLGRFDCLGHL